MKTNEYKYVIKDTENKKYLTGIGIGTCTPITGTIQWTTISARAMKCTLKQANNIIEFISTTLEYPFDLTLYET